jgi:hypothetical protein
MTAATDTGKPGGSPAARGIHAGRVGARRAAAWLHLAAAPSFALMALATMLDASPMTMMCASDMGGWSPGDWSVGGMAPMYFLMTAFHLGPWLEMASGRRGA